MKYDIQSRNDFGSGSLLVTRITEEDLDKKALYTIQADTPDFIFPFNFRSIDGQIEFVYQLGSYEKMQYNTGLFSAREYAEMWTGLLNPLLDCGDWFMRPYSFVLDNEYLYYDRQKNTVSYMYIPSVKDCSDSYSLKEMAVGLSNQISVDDVNLENKVLRAIMADFNPTELLMMLKPYMASNVPAIMQQPVREPAYSEVVVCESAPVYEPDEAQPDIREPDRDDADIIESESASPLDIVINIPFKRRDPKVDKKEPKKKGGRSIFSAH